MGGGGGTSHPTLLIFLPLPHSLLPVSHPWLFLPALLRSFLSLPPLLNVSVHLLHPSPPLSLLSSLILSLSSKLRLNINSIQLPQYTSTHTSIFHFLCSSFFVLENQLYIINNRNNCPAQYYRLTICFHILKY